MSRIIGIDLGTTNCCVAVVDGFRPSVLPNRSGYKTTPSMIAVTEDGRRLVGQLAVRQQITNPTNTVYGAKRLIGRTFDSRQVQHAIEHSAFAIVEGPRNETRIRLQDEDLSIPELSAMLLQEMRIVAEEHLGEEVTQAVVTVPAYFTDSQRQAVRDAGRIAGLEIVRILNEPTAAALAYGFQKEEAKTIVVYDMGGGTFDVSVVKIDPITGFDVIATTGDSYLGGEDFDDRIVAWLSGGFEEMHGIDLRASPVAIARLRQAAQKAKCELSELDSTEIQLPFLVTEGPKGALHLEVTMTRRDLEQLTGDLVTRSLTICERALRLGELRAQDVEEVILVGGMTRMPAIQAAVNGFFDREPCRGVHPDEVVALGAAIQGFVMDGEGGSGVVPLRDVTAHSLGIMVAGGLCDVLIPMNTTVPTRTTSVFSTSRDGQDTMKIVMLQGESENASENDFLGKFALNNLRSAPAGEVQVEVAFEIDSDGIFRVAAMDMETGEARGIEVLAHSGIADEEIERMMADAARYLATRRGQEKTEKERQGLDLLLADLDRLLPEAESRAQRTTVASTTLTKARQVVEHVRRVSRQSDIEDITKHAKVLSTIQSALKKALAAG